MHKGQPPAIGLLLLIAATLYTLGGSARTSQGRASASPSVVDEPLGARYSLGLTLWHLRHSPERIREFHEFLRKAGQTPEKLLSPAQLKPPMAMCRMLLEPELLTDQQLTGDAAKKPEAGKHWVRDKDFLMSMPQDAGPSVDFPLRVPRTGLYRLWVQYYGNANCRGLTVLRIYRAGEENLGPVMQPDEIYDKHDGPPGLVWKDSLVDLAAGNYSVRLSHAIPWWHGGTGYDYRKIDCFYLTDEIWAEPPPADQRKLMRESGAPQGIQWTFTPPLAAADRETWKWWQARPLSWESAAANPNLFSLSRQFWQGIVEDLATKDYSEEKDKLPNYRAPERQVVFNETWNMVANPVRARRQIDTLLADVRREPLGYNYVWHDVATNIPDLASANKPTSYGNWTSSQNCLFASYGQPGGTVATEVPVAKPGKYSMWVLSSSTNLSYTAPWFGTASVDGKDQFRYHHQGNIASVWMKMGEVTLDKPGKVKVEFTLDGAGAGGTYRRVYTLFLVDNPGFVPQGTIRPPWTVDMYQARAAEAGAKPNDRYLLWTTDNPYTPLSQEVWADKTASGKSWPENPVAPGDVKKDLLMAGDTVRAMQVCLRNLTEKPLSFNVEPGPLVGKKSYPGAVTWRVVAFAPYGADREAWTPFFLLRRPSLTVPPYNVAGVWLTVDTHGVAPGEYTSALRLTPSGLPARRVVLKVRVSAVKANPEQPVLVSGYTQPHEGEAYLRDYVEHGMKVWHGDMSKAEMKKWGLRLLCLHTYTAEDIARAKSKGLDYSDWYCPIHDEPGGKTEEELKPFLDVAKQIRAADPNVRISFNPGESAALDTFKVLAPYCDFWLPYSLHLSQYWGGPEKWAIYKAKPWMWYTTPCLWDKSPDLPNGLYAQIRQVPSQTSKCVGTAYFAMTYPWRDQWDTAYEHISDASTMGAVMSRYGPIPIRTWEATREALQHADLAMLVRERLGVKVFEEVKDPALQKLISEGSVEELVGWLEKNAEK
ncbi:MAG: hypothetical protein HY318_20105 [Armatimonadetes bacterium]|nr:hypothetical protein [Armatimonadota bacterium]